MQKKKTSFFLITISNRIFSIIFLTFLDLEAKALTCQKKKSVYQYIRKQALIAYPKEIAKVQCEKKAIMKAYLIAEAKARKETKKQYKEEKKKQVEEEAKK